MSNYYKEAGVNLEAGYESVERIKKHIERTKRLGMMGTIGSFGGLFDLSALKMTQPVLVCGTDGVGTKLKIAFELDRHDTIGQDVVAMCVNDVLAQGAQPLLFLDYIAVGKNDPQKIEQIVKGVSDGCVQAHCALIGGETAEMPDMYAEDDYDIAGFTVGAVEKDKIITSDKVCIGDVVIGLPSSGLHSNGYSLVRKILFKDHHIALDTLIEDKPLSEHLLTPTKIYVKPVLSVLDKINVHGIAHITGGGFYENMPRCIQSNQAIQIDRNSFKVPAIFTYLQTLSAMSEEEMFNVFNMGIGMILVVDKEDANQTLELLKQINEPASIIGKVVEGKGVIIQ